MNHFRLPPLVLLLAASLAGCSGANEDSGTSQKSLAFQSATGLSAEFLLHSQWNEGYCGEVVLENLHSSSVTTWGVQIDLAGAALREGWSGQFTETSGLLDVGPTNWNSTIAPGDSTRFGFCATRSGPTPLPTIVSVTDDLPGGGEDCVEVEVPEPQGRVEMRVSNVDDFVYLTVNGLRSRVWSYGGPDQGTRVDVTRWFTEGQNEVRLQAMNTGGPSNYSIEMWVDGELVVSESCSGACDPTDSDAEQGIILDRSLDVSLSGLPSAQTVSFQSSAGAIYVDGQYLGISAPGTFDLPPGDYSVGLGQSDDTPGAYTGQYFEQNITVNNCPVEVTLDEGTPLSAVNQTRLAILPIRETHHGGSDDIGVLVDADIPAVASQAEATSDAWVKPFSYGLTEWDVNVLPVVEDVPLLRDAAADAAPRTGQLLTDAGLEGLRSEYDIIVFYYSTHRADGSRVANLPCCIWAGGQDISYDTGWVRGAAPGVPSEGLYHESLHSYEWYNASLHGAYNGVGQLHGAEAHGYRSGVEGDWLDYYRAFARGQVAELSSMRPDIVYPNIPSSADIYVGIFDTMRYGTGPYSAASTELQAFEASVASPSAN